ncbi:Ankyrin repeats (3 copies) [Gimesia alba]|uniref:Ankyrin repeats (3 copies) n=2 Tax=Gimesia alba TaxID=2527973 RepID=A0A517RLF1_9PLAN|nr:Ankyrin repeats (3 copies) [Gimesia alba]
MIETNEVEYWAALGYLDKVQESIATGCNVNARGESGYTALHAAVVNEHAAIVRLLLEFGAAPSAQLESGETPADLARLTDNKEIIEMLS